MKQRSKDRPAAAPMYFLTRPAEVWRAALRRTKADAVSAPPVDDERTAA